MREGFSHYLDSSMPMLDSASNFVVNLLCLVVCFSPDKTGFYWPVDLLWHLNLVCGFRYHSYYLPSSLCLKSSRFYFFLFPAIFARLEKLLFLT